MSLPAAFKLAKEFPLTLSETIAVRQFRSRCIKAADTGAGIEPVCAGRDLDRLVRKIFKDRNVKRAHIKEVHLYSFRSVGMHIDDLHTQRYLSFLIPILGSGELQHIVKRKTKLTYGNMHHIVDQAIEPGFGYIFNDRKPHSFITKSKCCFALIGSVSKRAVQDYL